MSPIAPAYSKEEFARRGDIIYQRSVEPSLSAGDQGKFVAIDIDSGDFVVNADERTASDLLRTRKPQAQIWLRRVGSRYVRRFGGYARSAAR